jgi:hypothetical protein
VLVGCDPVAGVALEATPLEDGPNVVRVGWRGTGARWQGVMACAPLRERWRACPGGRWRFVHARSGADSGQKGRQKSSRSEHHRKGTSVSCVLPSFIAIERQPIPWSLLAASHGSGAFFGVDPGAGSGNTSERAE